MMEIPIYALSKEKRRDCNGRLGRKQGNVVAHALIDDEDFEKVSKYKWRLHKQGYPFATFDLNGKSKGIYMHRLVMNAPKGIEVDHKFHNNLDNRKSELRMVSGHQNQGNRRKSLFRKGKPCSSKYKGVYFDPRKKIWRISLKSDRRQFHSEIEAAKAYNKAALKHFGEYALLNKIPEPCEPITDWFCE